MVVYKWTPPRNSGGIPCVSTRFSLSMEMSRLTRDGTAEPVLRDQIFRHARGQGNIIFPAQLTTSRIGNLTRLIHALLYVMTIHTYIHTYILDAAAETRRNAASKHQSEPKYGDKQADAVRDCQTRLIRPNSQARTGTGKYSVYLYS